MTERVILAVKFTPAGTGSQVRKAVGGFLRYVQHRDLHPTQPEGRPRPEVSGLLKYVAYRDRASTRAELFGPSRTLTSEDRKAFAGFVANALQMSNPQFFRGRNGELRDRRRAVYRFVISPEHANGLDLRRLTHAAVDRLEQESGVTGLRWIAAIHRNTAHHHIHLVLAGMHQESNGSYRRIDVSKPRLAAMKEALAVEIEHQRVERVPSKLLSAAPAAAKADAAARFPRVETPRCVRVVRLAEVGRATAKYRPLPNHGSLIALRSVARRYQRRMETELEESYRQAQWERAA
jgi:hypothetical protein